MGSGTTFFPVSFNDIANVFDRGDFDDAADGWLGEWVENYVGGDRSWSATAYTLEKVCSMRGTSVQLETFDRGHDTLILLERLDALLERLEIDGAFYPRFLEPFPDRPVDLPTHEDWPNAAFFSNAALVRIIEQFDSARREIPPEMLELRARLDSEEHALDPQLFDRIVPYVQIDPAFDWDYLAVELKMESNPNGYYEAADYPIEGGWSLDVENAAEFIEGERRRTRQPFADISGVDVYALDMLFEWVAHSRQWARDGLDVAVFQH